MLDRSRILRLMADMDQNSADVDAMLREMDVDELTYLFQMAKAMVSESDWFLHFCGVMVMQRMSSVLGEQLLEREGD